MKIESLIRRKGGTRVKLDDTAYHFRPTEEDERHTADVTISAHVKRFLAIPEGYQPAELSDLPPGTVNPNPTHQQQTLAPSSDEEIPLDKMNQQELKALAKEVEIEGYSSMKRDALIKAIKQATGEADGEGDGDDGDESNDGQDGDGDDTNRNPVTDSTGGAGTDGDGGQGDNGADGAKPLDELSHDELVAAYKAKFNGKAPHHKLSDERIKQILAEEDE